MINQNNLIIKQYHSFAVPANLMCFINTDLGEVRGFFENSFYICDDVIMRKFCDVSESGLESPDRMIIGEGVIISVEMME